MLRVGLTGGIASGKSQVLRVLAGEGFFTLDLDRVAHELMAPGGAAHAAVLGLFGPGVAAPDGGIDRRVLGSIVFSDPAARGRLDALVHPLVRDAEAQRLAQAQRAGAAVAVSDAALLVESGGHLRYDRLVVAWCPPDEQRRRLRAREGLDEAAANARLAAQMPTDEKRRFAHFELPTEGRLEETEARAHALAGRLRAVPGPAAAPAAPVVVSALPPRGPGGLDTARFLHYLDAAPRLEMKELAALLDPPPSGPWYRAAQGRPALPGPELLAAPVAAHCLKRRGDDPEFLAAVAASIARLTHADPGAIARAVLAALAAGSGRDPAHASDAQRALARRWGGA